MRAGLRAFILVGALLMLTSPQHAGTVTNAFPRANGAETSANLVAQMLKLIQAHTSPIVIREFVGAWSVPYLTSVADLVRLRKAGANEELLTAFARRGAELRLRASRASESRQHSNAATNIPPVLIIPVPAYPGPSSALPPVDSGPGIPPSLFSEGLWWWGNAYPFPRW